MNEKSWATPCPKYDCKKTACKCGLEYVNIPTSLGDDSEGGNVAPKNGAYCNALVIYEANNHVYIYSKEGVPTLIDVDASDISTLEQEVRKAQRDVQELREDIDRFAYFFDTVAGMRASDQLQSGDYARTLGYYSKNDEGGAYYKVTNVQPSGYYETLGNMLYAELIIEDTMNVKQFGAKGDGTADDTISIQKAIDSCDEVLIPTGTYMIKAQDDEHKTGPYNHNHAEYNGGIHLKSNLKISGEGTLRVITTDAENYCVLRAYNCDNIEITGIKIIGDRTTHSGVDGEYGHGIMLMHCGNISIHNISISQTWGDGIYIGVVYGNTIDKQNENIHISNISVDHISRDGISLCSVDGFTLENSVFDTIDRKDPKAGINMEPEGYGTTTPYINDIKIENCRFYDCWRAIYSYINEAMDTTKPSNITVSNCTSYRGINGISLLAQASFNETVEGRWTFNDFTVVDAGWNGIGIINHYLKLPHIFMNNITVNNCNQTNKNTDDNQTGYRGGSGISIYSQDGLYDCGNIVINSPSIINTKDVNYINKPIWIEVTNSNSNIILNSPIILDGLHANGLWNVLIHDTNDIMETQTAYYEKLITASSIYTTFKMGLVSGEAILSFRATDITKIADDNEFTVINNRDSGYLRIDLGSDVDTRAKVYPFDNTNRYISTNTPGASMTIKKINGQWFATKMMGTWSN